MRLLAHKLQPPTATLKTNSSLARAHELLGVRKTDAGILNLGSGNTDYGKNVINLDVVLLPNVTVVADAAQLPFQGESLDAVFAQAVLEHVRRPYRAVQEIYRVLKPGGGVYVDVPFVQVYHNRVDFQRYTADGLRELFRDFEVVDVGVSVSPASALVQVTRYALAVLFSFGNRYLFRLFELVLGWMLFPLRYLNLLVADNNRYAHICASGLYLFARKREGRGD